MIRRVRTGLSGRRGYRQPQAFRQPTANRLWAGPRVQDPTAEKATMLQAVRYVVWAVTKVLVCLRYRIRVHGLEELRGLKGPVLILPNHPAYIDPVLVLSGVGPYLRPRPLIYEG